MRCGTVAADAAAIAPPARGAGEPAHAVDERRRRVRTVVPAPPPGRVGLLNRSGGSRPRNGSRRPSADGSGPPSTFKARTHHGRYPSQNYLEAGSHVMVDDNEPASVDALTAQGGFLARLGMAGDGRRAGPRAAIPGAPSPLPRHHRPAARRPLHRRRQRGDTMVDVGPGIVDLLGMTREEWLATSEGWRDVLHPDDLDRIVEASERTAATGEPFREQYRAIHRDGREVWIREEAIRVERRGRQPAVLARPDARRHGLGAHGARAAGGADEVRRARRADPRDRLRRRRRRADVDELRQPADRGVPGHHARGVHRRSRPVGDSTCTRRTATRRSPHTSRGARRASRSRSSTA